MQIIYIVLVVILYFCIVSFLFIQPLAAIIRLIMANRKDSKYAIGLKRYLSALALFYLSGFISSSHWTREYELTMTVINIVLFLAVLFGYWHHVIKWHYKFKRIKEYDRMNLIKSAQESNQYGKRIFNKSNYILYSKLQLEA